MLDQRVERLPSVAADAGNWLPFSSEEAVVGWLRAMSVVPHPEAAAAFTVDVVAAERAARPQGKTSTAVPAWRKRDPSGPDG
jgi:hypothetical protein